jgi:hypothetical protein
MFGYSKLFRNRWWALLWAAGICWMAYDVAAPGDEAAGNNAAASSADADVAALQDAINRMQ